MLENERMTGQYNLEFGGIEHTVTWDIERRLDIEPTMDRVPLDWRPRGGDEANTVENHGAPAGRCWARGQVPVRAPRHLHRAWLRDERREQR